jgi:GAF domain-containing protein
MAALNAVSEVASRELDLDRLLSRVVDVVLSVFDAQGARLLILESGPASSPRVIVSRGIPPALGASALNDTCLECPTSCWGMLEQLPPGEITVITECNDLPREALRAAGFAGYVGVLLPVGRQVRAVLNLVWRAPRTLDDSDRALLRALARQIGIAADNVALDDAEQRARQAADKIASVSVTLNRTLKLGTVLQTLFEHLGRFVSYDRAKVMLLERESRSGFRIFHPSGSSDAADAIPSPLVTEVLRTGRSLCVADLRSHPGTPRRPQGEIDHSWLGVPLLAADRVIGLVTLA